MTGPRAKKQTRENHRKPYDFWAVDSASESLTSSRVAADSVPRFNIAQPISHQSKMPMDCARQKFGTLMKRRSQKDTRNRATSTKRSLNTCN
jgi:hypothetical protein